MTFAFDRPIRVGRASRPHPALPTAALTLPVLWVAQSVAIDPEYPKRKKNVFVTGGMAGNLVYHEDKSWALFGNSTKQKTVRQRCLRLPAASWSSCPSTCSCLP